MRDSTQITSEIAQHEFDIVRVSASDLIDPKDDASLLQKKGFM